MDKISQFWNWFAANNKAYTFLEDVDEEMKESLLNGLVEQLHEYCENLYFEIGGMPGEDVELIITAEGDTDYFDKVEELISNAPSISGWQLIAFKPAMPDDFVSSWDDLELNTEDMWFRPIKNNSTTKLEITIYLKNYDLIKDNEILDPLIFKMLDTILGEKSFAKDIGSVDFDLQPDEPGENGLYPIIQLPEYIKKYKSQLRH